MFWSTSLLFLPYTWYSWLISISPLATAVEIVPGDDCRAALCVFVSGAILGIVAAFDASTGATGFDELDVVVIAQANTILGVSFSAGAPAGVVLTPCVPRVQPTKFLGADTSSDYKLEIRVSNRAGR